MKPRSNIRHLTGMVSGRLTVIRQSGRTSDGHVLWLCRCSCGTKTLAASNSFLAGQKKSCGCLRADAGKKRFKRDGVWNDGKSYAIQKGARCYKTRCAWSRAVIRHYGNRCEICGWDEARCDTHHRIPKAQGGLHTIKNGQVLCPNHHRLAKHDQ